MLTTKLTCWALLLITGVVIASACSSEDATTGIPGLGSASPGVPGISGTDSPPTVIFVASPETISTQEIGGIEESAFAAPTGPVELTALDGTELAAAKRHQLSYNWFTDFNHRSVDLSEITTLLPRDRIKPVDAPEFGIASEPPPYMRDREPVIVLEVDGDARAYPLAILMWQEIVNDTVGGMPVTVTFCPLCNTAITFSRVVDGFELTFGTSGNLRNSDLVMWDRLTQSWWHQATGEAIVGSLTGKRLSILPSAIMAWETFQAEYPQGKVLLREFDEYGQAIRPYHEPPYAGYDSVDADPFAFNGVVDGRLPANARVLTVKTGSHSVAYAWSLIADWIVLNNSVGDEPVVVFFNPENLSAFRDRRGEDVVSGSTSVFFREVDGRTLTFRAQDGKVVDAETGSVWSAARRAVSGPLVGSVLTQVIHQNHFWFAWAVFEPGTELRSEIADITGPVG